MHPPRRRLCAAVGMVGRRSLPLVLLIARILQAHAAPAAEPLSAPIDAQPLPQALAAFGELSHLQLVYVSQITAGKMSQAVSPGSSTVQSLTKLLQGTGLSFLFLNERTVEIFERRESSLGNRVDPPAALEEVVVTSTKRSETLRTVPMSISVLSVDDMHAAGIKDIGGVAAVTTGVEFDASSQFGPGILTNLAIRGISADKGDATTGIYIDDTPIQSAYNTFGDVYPVTFDMAQVELLRGPQGVLFGRNAEGGAIRFVTNEPSTTTDSLLYRAEFSSTERGGFGYEAGAAGGAPIVEGTLGARASVWYRRDGGYIDRIDPFTGAILDADANHAGTEAVRLALAFEPNDALRIVPSVSYQSVKLHDSPNFYVDAATSTAGSLDNGKLLRQPSVDSFTLASIKLTQGLQGANLTTITSFFDRAAMATVDSTNAAGVYYFSGYGNPLGPAFPTSYANAVPSLVTLHQIQWSEELRVASADSAARLTWMGGLFYLKRRENNFRDTYVIVAPTVPGILSDENDFSTEISAFGQARWSFTSRLSLGAGMRIGRLHNESYERSGGFANTGAAPVSAASDYEHLPPTPRFDLTYQMDPQKFFYATIAKGFRSGGSNGLPTVACPGGTYPTAYAPDSVWSFEIGAKNQLFDHRLQLNASVYDIHWNNIQESVDDACDSRFTTNSGAARSTGFDLDAEAVLTDRLRVSMAVGMVDVRYTRTVANADGTLIVDRGTQVGGVPSVPAPWSGTVSARYEWPLEAGTVYVRIENTVRSHNPGPFSEWDPRNINYAPLLRADPATDMLNLNIGLHRSCAHLKFFVTNALNRLPLLQSIADSAGSSLNYAYTLRPRTVGVAGSCGF
jgi:iron complex outermembrane recepter protein